MGDYLKLFEEHADYETYIEGQDVILPNVSYCEDNNCVHYNPQINKNIIYKASAKLQESNYSGGEDNVGIYVTALDATIESHTFENGVGIVKFDSDLTTIGKWAFLFTEITEITIPKTVTTIGAAAFGGSDLTTITIPDSVTSIGGSAFNGCTSLSSITIEATTPPTLGSVAFDNTNNCPIYVPAASVDTYKAASGWSTYASRIQAIA